MFKFARAKVCSFVKILFLLLMRFERKITTPEVVVQSPSLDSQNKGKQDK